MESNETSFSIINCIIRLWCSSYSILFFLLYRSFFLFFFFFDLPSFSFSTYVGVCMGCPSYIPNSTVSYLSYLLPSQLSEKRKKMSFSHSFSMVPCYIVFLASKFFNSLNTTDEINLLFALDGW
jgi:hypothetical protein